MHTARTALSIAAVALFAVAEADAQWRRSVEPTGQLRFRLGLFEPSGSSDGWDAVFEGFTGDPSDLRDTVWGTDFLWRLAPSTGLLFGTSFYDGSATSGYEDWVAADGSEIRHTTRLEIADLTAAFVVRLDRGAIRPYAGLGGGFLWWSLTDQGSFIDFSEPDLPVFTAWYGAEGTTFSAFGLAGLEVPLSLRWSLLVEGRYRWASDTLGDDFAGFGDLDLSGWEASGGFGISF
jgi:hypothetical protein